MKHAPAMPTQVTDITEIDDPRLYAEHVDYTHYCAFPWEGVECVVRFVWRVEGPYGYAAVHGIPEAWAREPNALIESLSEASVHVQRWIAVAVGAAPEWDPPGPPKGPGALRNAYGSPIRQALPDGTAPIVPGAFLYRDEA